MGSKISSVGSVLATGGSLWCGYLNVKVHSNSAQKPNERFISHLPPAYELDKIRLQEVTFCPAVALIAPLQ